MQIDRSVQTDQLDRARAVVLELVADHLAAARRHAEALRGLERPVAADVFSGGKVSTLLRGHRETAALAQRAHALELAIALRLQQAQRLLTAARRSEPGRSALLRLISAAVDDLAALDPRQPTGLSSDFFASRGLSETVSQGTGIADTYRLGGRVPLSDVLDMISAAGDLIDSLRRTHA